MAPEDWQELTGTELVTLASDIMFYVHRTDPFNNDNVMKFAIEIPRGICVDRMLQFNPSEERRLDSINRVSSPRNNTHLLL